MTGRVVARRPVVRVVTHSSSKATSDTRHDELAGEEPMEVRVDDQPVAVTMRTPGNDFELALGFCLTEGILDDPTDVATISYCAGAGPGRYNVVEVRRRRPAPLDARVRRNVYMTSSCGVCGTTSIDAVATRARPVHHDDTRITAATFVGLPDTLRREQRVFARTGGLHAAAIFSARGDLCVLREDVGRHNAVDKAIGWSAMHGRLPARGHVLMVSGRVAFEIVQKAAVAGIPVIAAVSAPTSLAVDLADSLGMTLVGFLRGETMNVYSGAARVDS